MENNEILQKTDLTEDLFIDEKTPESAQNGAPLESFPECETSKAKKIYFRQFALAGTFAAVLLLGAVVLLEVLNYMDYELSVRLFQGFLLGYLLYHVLILIKNRKTWKELFTIWSRCESVVDVFDGYFTLTTHRDGIEIARHRFDFSDLRRVSVSGDLMTVTARGQIFFLDKTQIPEDSRLGKALAAVRERSGSLNPKDKKTKLLLLPAALCVVLTIVLVLVQRNAVFQDPGKLTPVFLIAYLVLVTFLLIWGIVFRKNRSVALFSGLASIVTALIILFFALPQGVPAAPKQESADPSFVLETEEKFGFELPETELLYCYDNTEDPDALKYSNMLRSATLFYENGELEDVVLNEHFIDRIPTELVGLSSCTTENGELLLYNVDTGEYNTMPEKEGKTHFICVSVDREGGFVELSEYYVDVVLS